MYQMRVLITEKYKCQYFIQHVCKIVFNEARRKGITNAQIYGFSPNRGQKSVHNFKKSRKERLKLYRTVGHMCAVNLECILEG